MRRFIMSKELFHTSIKIDDRCVDLLLTESEAKTASNRAQAMPTKIPVDGQCWPIEKPNSKCRIWDFVTGKCSCSDKSN